MTGESQSKKSMIRIWPSIYRSQLPYLNIVHQGLKSIIKVKNKSKSEENIRLVSVE